MRYLQFLYITKHNFIGSVAHPGNWESYPQRSPPGSTLWSTDGTREVFQLTLVSPTAPYNFKLWYMLAEEACRACWTKAPHPT